MAQERTGPRESDTDPFLILIRPPSYQPSPERYHSLLTGLPASARPAPTCLPHRSPGSPATPRAGHTTRHSSAKKPARRPLPSEGKTESPRPHCDHEAHRRGPHTLSPSLGCHGPFALLLNHTSAAPEPGPLHWLVLCPDHSPLSLRGPVPSPPVNPAQMSPPPCGVPDHFISMKPSPLHLPPKDLAHSPALS